MVMAVVVVVAGAGEGTMGQRLTRGMDRTVVVVREKMYILEMEGHCDDDHDDREESYHREMMMPSHLLM